APGERARRVRDGRGRRRRRPAVGPAVRRRLAPALSDRPDHGAAPRGALLARRVPQGDPQGRLEARQGRDEPANRALRSRDGQERAPEPRAGASRGGARARAGPHALGERDGESALAAGHGLPLRRRGGSLLLPAVTGPCTGVATKCIVHVYTCREAFRSSRLAVSWAGWPRK